MQEHFNRFGLRKFILLGLALLLGVALTACGTGTSSLAIGDKAPDFTLTNANGQSVSLRDYTDRQQPILLYFHMALG